MKKILFVLIVLSACGTTKNNDNACKGSSKKDCACTMQYDPVCGCDNKTYSNACAADCEGVKSFTKGPCPTK